MARLSLICIGGFAISRSRNHPTARLARTPALLLDRCGLAAAIACAALTLAPAPSPAQEKPGTPPKQDLPPTNDPAEILRRIKAEAEKQGVKTEQPTPPPAPAATPVPAPVPAPVTTPPQPPAGGVKMPTPSATQPGGPGKEPKIPGTPNPAAKSPPSITQPGGRPAPGTVPGAVPMIAPGGTPPGLTGAPLEGTSKVQGDNYTFSVDAREGVELVKFVPFLLKDALNIDPIFLDGGLAGQKIYFNAPFTIKLKDVLPFATMLLEQREYTLRQDATGIYFIEPKQGVAMTSTAAAVNWGTTRIIHTPNIKPSTLQNSITAIITNGRAGQAGAQPIFMDDLGLIIMTDTPRVLSLVEDFVKTLVTERAALKFYRFELMNISAASAKDRVLELLGQQAQRTAAPAVPGAVPGAAGGLGPSGTITNLAERLTVDPTSNALFLRGREEERTLLADMLAVVDLPNAMLSRWYPVGNKAAFAVASQGRAEQLGSFTTFDFESQGSTGSSGVGSRGLGLAPGSVPSQSGQTDTTTAGAGFVLYPEAGGFIYRGTELQQARVAALVDSLKIISIDEHPTFEFYKLRHGKSTDVAEIIQNLLSNSSGTGNRGGLLGSDLGRGRSNTTRNSTSALGTRTGSGANPAGANPAAGAAGLTGGLGDLDGADVFVLADEPNNQVLVKAPAKLQPQFRQLIGKIDLRRSQVYIDCKIINVSENDSFRLAVEAQQIIGQFAFNTNFGLGSLTSSSTTGTTTTTTGGLTSPKNVATGLSGITAALIRSKDVPLVVTALASNIDSRIVATPQLLVDDNEEAEISSLDQQPTGSTSQSTAAGSTITGFQDYQSAGPKLTVKPQISEGGYLRLEYNIELSAFQGAGSGNLPPPKIENKIKSKVMVPTDATIVVGGLKFEQTGNTVVKVPFIGDIPLVGNLFKDQSKTGRTSTLFVFITPKIMRDPSFADLRLLTRAPLAEVRLPSEYPAPQPEAIPVIDTARFQEDERLRAEREKHKEPAEISPAKGAPVRRDKPASDEPN